MISCVKKIAQICADLDTGDIIIAEILEVSNKLSGPSLDHINLVTVMDVNRICEHTICTSWPLKSHKDHMNESLVSIRCQSLRQMLPRLTQRENISEELCELDPEDAIE